MLRKYHPSGRRPAIPVHGPRGTARQVARAYGLAKHPGMKEEFTFVEYDAQPVAVGPLVVTPVRVRHPVPAYGLRVEHDGHVLAYTGDTGPCPELVVLAKDADVLLSEAAFQEGGDNPEDLHLTGRDAGETATSAGVGRLLLTHVPAWYDPAVALAEAVACYAGPAELVAPGATYDI